MQAHIQLNNTRRFRSKPVLTVKSIAVRGVSPLVRKLASNAQAEEVEEGRGGSHSSGSPASEEFIPLDARQRQQAVNRSQAFWTYTVYARESFPASLEEVGPLDP